MLFAPRPTTPALAPPSRPLSPSMAPARPRSRSEMLLRDTLRRAEEHERRQGSSRSVIRSPQARKDFFVGRGGSQDDLTDGEGDEDAHSSRPTFDYSLRLPPVTTAPRPVRRRSTSRASRGAPDAAFYPYGSPSSPSPMPPMLPRTRTEPVVATQKRVNPPRHHPPLPSSSTQLHVQVQGRTMRTSRSPSQSHANSVDTSPMLRPTNLSPVSPHEAVLRSRLEGVLKKAHAADEQDSESKSSRTSHRRTNSNSPSVGPGQANANEWTSSSENSSRQSLDGLLFSGLPGLKQRPKPGVPSLQPDRSLYGKHTSPPSPDEPITPPSTPPFNARSASELCKRMDGYVSFAHVEGLGEPPEVDVDGDEDVASGKKGWIKRLRWPFGMSGPGTGTPSEEGFSTGSIGLIIDGSVTSEVRR